MKKPICKKCKHMVEIRKVDIFSKNDLYNSTFYCNLISDKNGIITKIDPVTGKKINKIFKNRMEFCNVRNKNGDCQYFQRRPIFKPIEFFYPW